MASWWPQARVFFSKLDRFQRLALAVCAFGLATAFLFAFAASAFFGAGHMAPPRCFTLVAFKGDKQVGSTFECLNENNDGLNLSLPTGATRLVILDGKGRKAL